MKKLSGLIAIAILFSNASYAEERQESGFEAMKRECRNGKALSCGLVGSMFVEGKDTDGNKIPQNIPIGMQLLTTSCNAGDISACTSLGGFYRDGQYIKEDKFKAAKIFKTICDIGSNEFGSSSGLACFQLGIMTKNGEGVLKDKYKAIELFNKACTLGISHGCTFAKNIEQGIF